MKNKIRVTKTFLPPQDEYQSILSRAWDKNWITNRGVLVEELENSLKTFLEVSNLIATTNGTLPLQIAIKALNLTGEIITTPFSYVATTSSIVWQGCTPVFVDIDPEYFTIDETKIEAAITKNTSAILATHVYGNPCNVLEIERIAKKHQLKVIYDAAHSFGVRYKGKSIFNFGDVSTCSFHATKIFHTGEGGAIFCKNKYYDDMFNYHNFGHNGEEEFHGLGINAKMSEPQAAMGLAMLPYLQLIFKEREVLTNLYNSKLKNSRIELLKIREGTDWNHSYYPVIFKTESQLLKVRLELEKRNIYPRRYFFPSLNKLPYLTYKSCPVSEKISALVLCLPLYPGLEESEANIITDIINANV
ncbi:DegT/DnrJ/EryC1/StrS family aminotransferase [uncultured Algibacter sp.]|uniref:DegT/DnrJ/EryC1/StrS family aminotransferase n=1 Tax=uncultured Algibacter sp. TaxID=298659 RepID=UPI002615E1FF|nr:DegT/DnrJ/EryC1/StrS family aminotransferase [uncultured Algibacter sp.]